MFCNGFLLHICYEKSIVAKEISNRVYLCTENYENINKESNKVRTTYLKSHGLKIPKV